MDAQLLKDRGAVITGAGRGIGEAIARQLAEAGAAVVLAARNEIQLRAAVEAITERGGEAHAVVCDVSRPESVQQLAERSRELLGHVDILVNNAGIGASAPLQRQTLENWNQVMAINATGTFLCTQAFAGFMAQRGWGRIVNVASVAAKTGAPYTSAYSASKHAVLGFTRSIAAELGPKGITVNAVCPGFVDTQMTWQTVANVTMKTGMEEADALDAVLHSAGQDRLVKPEEVAHTVLCLCAALGGAINGQAIVVDGGGLRA